MSDGFLMIEGFDGASTANGDDTLFWNLLPDGMRGTAFHRNGTHGIGVTAETGHAGAWQATSCIFDTPTPHLLIGFALRATVEVSLSELRLLELRAPNTEARVRIGLTGNRTFWVKAGNSEFDVENSGVQAYSTYALESAQWYYVEVSVAGNLADGTARIVIQVNGPPGIPGSTGAQVIDVTVPRGIRLQSGGGGYPLIPADGGYAAFQVGILDCPSDAVNTVAFDDFYVRNGAIGGFVGDSAVVNIGLESDRAVAFTPSTGANNYALVDEIAPDDDGTYNEAAADGADVFEVADQVLTGFIHCVQLAPRARKTEAEAWSLETLIELDGTTRYGAVHYLATSYASPPPDCFGDAPGKTGWTLTDMNAMGVGYRGTVIPSS